MEIIYLPQAEGDLSYWIKSGNKSILKKIALLTRAVVGNPYKGIGKPYELAPKWSRRITKEHRFVYQVLDNKLFVFSLRGHYV